MHNLERLNILYHQLFFLSEKASIPAEMESFLKLNNLDQKIMNILFENDRCSINQLNKVLNRSKSTMTSAVKRLEKLNLVSRAVSPDDKRVIDIYLTEQGIKLQKSHHMFEHILFSKILSVFDDDREAKCFLDSLEKILRHFENEFQEV